MRRLVHVLAHGRICAPPSVVDHGACGSMWAATLVWLRSPVSTRAALTEDFTSHAYVGINADSSGLYGTAKFTDNACTYAGISGEARAGQTLGPINLEFRVQF